MESQAVRTQGTTKADLATKGGGMGGCKDLAAQGTKHRPPTCPAEELRTWSKVRDTLQSGSKPVPGPTGRTSPPRAETLLQKHFSAWT